MNYGEKLKYIREEAGLSQYEVSDILGLNKRVYGQYEREYVNIPIKHLITLADYFNVSIDYIFNLNKNKSYKNIRKEYDINLIKERFKEFRKDNKLTQVQIANFLNIDQPTWSIYEHGKSIIGTPFLFMICKKYNISADYLLGKIDNKNG